MDREGSRPDLCCNTFVTKEAYTNELTMNIVLINGTDDLFILCGSGELSVLGRINSTHKTRSLLNETAVSKHFRSSVDRNGKLHTIEFGYLKGGQ